jgi:hypothetical protein
MSGVRGELRIDARDRGFAERVMIDVNLIAKRPAGWALLQRLEGCGRAIEIRSADRTVPPNAAVWTGNDVFVIAYDPDHWPNPALPGSQPSDVVLFGLMLHALEVASGTADPSLDASGDVSQVEQDATAQYCSQSSGG